MLYWNTVDELLKECLLILMKSSELSDFRLLGGTALSLHLGHRMSVDIDLFTDATYGSVDFEAIEKFLKTSFANVTGDFGGNPGIGKSYLIGPDADNVVKLDIYYSMDPFFQKHVEIDGIRMASVDEITAMKVDIVQRTGRKKDFWDLHELLLRYNVNEMISLHRRRFEWTHDEALICRNFTMFSEADFEPDPLCLRDKYWEFIKEDLQEAIANR